MVFSQEPTCKQSPIKSARRYLQQLLPQLCTELENGQSNKRMHICVSQTFSNVFSSMKVFDFGLKFQLILFLRVQLTIFHHWIRQWLGVVQATSHYLKQWWLVYRCMYASLGLNMLISSASPETVLQKHSHQFYNNLATRLCKQVKLSVINKWIWEAWCDSRMSSIMFVLTSLMLNLIA